MAADRRPSAFAPTPTLPALKESPSQTAGPYVHIGLTPSRAGLEGPYDDPGQVIAGPDAEGERIAIEGVVFDRLGAPIRDAVIELWQADAHGLYPSPEDPRGHSADPQFFGWGRTATDPESGLFRFETVKPGPVPGPALGPGGPMMAPHVLLWIVARGINVGLLTRLYFDDEADANESDPILARIEHAERRRTLVAARQPAKGGKPPVYRLAIRIGGPDETVFFDA
jgi:protocatechuate 3,4-dioxygenase alpha subunit